MTNEIIKAENIQLIVQESPKAYSENQISRDRCIAYGKGLLERINYTGMTDELDQEAAKYINMSRATIKKMNDKRSPLTKLFDEVRANFTVLENEIDPSKKDTLPYQLQQLRNLYAAQKRAEEERKRQELVMRQQQQAALARHREEWVDAYNFAANRDIKEVCNKIMNIFASVTLENYDESMNAIRSVEYEDMLSMNEPLVMPPRNVPFEMYSKILDDVKEHEVPLIMQRMAETLAQTKHQYLDLMPSKKAELERAARASAEEAERIRQQITQREAEEAARKEQELREQQERERKQAEAKKQADSMGSLFDNAEAGMQAYTPKSSVKKKLIPLNVEAFPEILSMWWQCEGKNLSVEELSKMFKKQITFCEKLALKGELIRSEHICYDEEVKAK